MKIFNLEYLDSYWRRRTNLDIISLFITLALLVRETKEEIQWVIFVCIDPQWLLGIDEVIDKAKMGDVLDMGLEPWRKISGGESSLQSLVVWSSATPR